MNDSNMASPASVPGLAHAVSPTALSTSRDDSVSCQSTGWEEERGAKRSDQGHTSADELDPCTMRRDFEAFDKLRRRVYVPSSQRTAQQRREENPAETNLSATAALSAPEGLNCALTWALRVAA